MNLIVLREKNMNKYKFQINLKLKLMPFITLSVLLFIIINGVIIGENAEAKDKPFSEGLQFYIKAIKDEPVEVEAGSNLVINFEYKINPDLSPPLPESFVSVLVLFFQEAETKDDYKQESSLFREIKGSNSRKSIAFLKNNSNLKGEGIATVYLRADMENKDPISNELKIPVVFK